MFQPFPTVSLENASKKVRPLFEQSIQRLGMLPKAHQLFALSPAFYSSYLATFLAFLADTEFTAIERHVIFLAASHFNECEYCTDIHGQAARDEGVTQSVLESLKANEPIEDEKLEALRITVNRIMESHGKLSGEELEDFFQAGYTHAQLLDLLLGVASKVMSNYANLMAGTTPEGR